jgi:hypothetical protein
MEASFLYTTLDSSTSSLAVLKDSLWSYLAALLSPVMLGSRFNSDAFFFCKWNKLLLNADFCVRF